MSIKHAALRGVNDVIRPLGVQFVPGRTTDPDVKGFLSARKTIRAARRAGLAVGDYIDQIHAEPGVSAATVDAMIKLSDLDSRADRVCEIGAGSGRYTEKVIEALRPRTYEAYETAADWLPYLRRLPHVITPPCDGRTLAGTATASVDLVHAQKVFVYLLFTTTVSYLREMARVVRPGGAVAFDVVTEDCLEPRTLDNWVAGRCLYAVTPRDWLLKFMAERELSLQGNFFAPMTGGQTELFVFRRV